MKITFCGAARIVTGSCYLIETKKQKILVDCGMFQGPKAITRLNYKPFLFNPKEISHVFLTHAHIDHSGLIPKLVKHGFKGKIHATPATKDLCGIMLEDSAYIQEKDTEHENRRRKKKGLAPRKPLYDQKDARKSISHFRKIKYDEEVKFGDIRVKYNDAGHIIGSAVIEMFISEGGKEKKIVFSGDLGQWDVPIIRNPTMIKDADYIFIESTYGDRLHEGKGIRDDMLLEYAKKTYNKGGKLLIPSFAIERTQEILYAFNKLIKKGKFPEEKIFLDSPLAIKATQIFKRHKDYFDKEALTKYKEPFSFPNLEYTLRTRESKALNDYKKPCVIIAGSGMCTGGRIRHHIKHHIEDSKTTLLFVGYQAESTLGRMLLEGAKKAKMMGAKLDVNAEIGKINAFSAHADYNELLKWMDHFEEGIKKVFIVHGEEKSSIALKSKLKRFNCHIPRIGETVEI